MVGVSYPVSRIDIEVVGYAVLHTRETKFFPSLHEHTFSDQLQTRSIWALFPRKKKTATVRANKNPTAHERWDRHSTPSRGALSDSTPAKLPDLSTV